MAAEKITSDNNINAAAASISSGQLHLDIEVLAASQQLVPTGDGGIYYLIWMFNYYISF